MVRTFQEIIRAVIGIERLDQQSDAGALRLFASVAHIGEECRARGVGRNAVEHARQTMQGLGAKLMRIFETARDAVGERLLAPGQGRKAELASAARRRIDAGHRHADVLQPLANVLRWNVIGKLALDGLKTGPRRRVDPVEERRFAKQHRDIGAEAEMTIHDARP